VQRHRPIITQHRVQRLVLWALAMLSWCAGVLFGDRPISIRHIQQRFGDLKLTALTRFVRTLVALRAVALAGVRRPRRRTSLWRRGRNLQRSHFPRSLAGARLRRLLKRDDLATRIARLVHVLRNIDAYAQPLVRRFRRGLTRLWRVLPPIGGAQTLRACCAIAPHLADTS